LSNELASGTADAPVAAPPPSAPTSNSSSSDPGPVDLDQPSSGKVQAERARDADQRESEVRELLQRVRERPERPDAEPVAEHFEAPKSWRNKEAFARLDPELQREIAENEANRERYHAHRTREPAEIERQITERVQRQYAEQMQAIEQQRAAADQLFKMHGNEIQLFAGLQQGVQAFNQKYAGLTKESFAQIQQTQPELAAQIVHDHGVLQTAQAQLKELVERRVHRESVAAQQQQAEHQAKMGQAIQQQQEAWKQYADAQDKAFSAKFANDGADMGDRAARFMTDVIGVPQERLVELWNSNPLFRATETQTLIRYALRAYEMEQAAKNARPVAQPKPLMPGQGAPANGAGPGDLAAAAESGRMADYIAMRNKGAVR